MTQLPSTTQMIEAERAVLKTANILVEKVDYPKVYIRA